MRSCGWKAMQTLQKQLSEKKSESRDLRGLTVGALIENDVNSFAFDNAHYGFVRAQVDSYSLIVSYRFT